MNKIENAKSSDEILNELFDSLNLPISPKHEEKSWRDSEGNNYEESKNSSNEISEDNDLSTASTTDQEIDKLLEEIADISDKNVKIDISPKLAPVTKGKKKKKKKLRKETSGKSKSKKKKKRKGREKKLNASENESSKSTTHGKKSKKSKSATPERKRSKMADHTHISDKSRKSSNICEKYKTKKRSRSISKSRSRTRSRSHSYSKTKRSYSRSRSKSKTKKHSRSRPTSRSRHHYSHSRSRSSQRNGSHKSKRHCCSNSGSFSPSPRREHKEKIKHRSKSRSPEKKETQDPLDVWRTAKLASLNKNLLEVKYDSKLISSKSQSLEEKTLEKKDVQIENIPLPVSTSLDSALPNPSIIPLPSVDSDKGLSKEIDLQAIPIPSLEDAHSTSTNETNTVNEAGGAVSSQKSESAPKSQEKAREEGKGKVIVIKSLKDSVVFQQAEEEAQKKAKTEEDNQSLLQSSPASENRDDVLEKTTTYEGNDKALLKFAVAEDEEDEDEDEGIEVLCEIKDKSDCSTTQKETKAKTDKDVIEEGEIASGEDSDVSLHENKKSRERKEKKGKKGKGESPKNHKKKEDKKKARRRSTSRSRARRKSRSSSRRRSGSKSKHRKSRSKSKKRSRKLRSRSRMRRKSRSRSRSKKSKSRSRSEHRSGSTSRAKRSKSESGGRKRSSRSRSESSTRTKTSRRKRRSSSRDNKERSPDCVDSLRDKATRKRLLEVARRNAVYLMKNNCLPPIIEKESVKATGKSVEELTSFCQQLVAKEYSDTELSDPSLSPDEQDSQFEKPFAVGRHPFAIKDSKPILMNIRNAPMLPTKTNAERLADTSKLRELFPVSSGSQHRSVAESGWVPVEKDETKDKEELMVFPEPRSSTDVDLSQLVSTRLSAMRRLQDNPADQDAKKALDSAQKEMQDWALSKQKPGQFTGSTGARILSQEELSSGYQAWARKEQFKEANPVSSQFGLKMLQKMGWNPGEGLGKNKEGQIEPLVLDVKMDKKGLTAPEEMTPRRTPIPLTKSLAGKHPVSALVEICSKRKWSPPEFEIVFDCGPDHKKNFLMKVHVNNQTYKPAIAASTKKIAKANAAAACLQALGLIPKDPPPKPQGTLHTIPQPHHQGAATANAHPPLHATPHSVPHSQAGLLGSAPQMQQSPPRSQDPLLNLSQSQSLRVALNIPTPQPPPPSLPVPLPPSAPPPLPDESGAAGPPGEEASPLQIGTTPTAASPKNLLSPSLGSQPVVYPPSMGGVHYGASNLYASTLQYEPMQYYSGPYQQPPF